ncbi:TlpA family protein disulfide reductase [Parashewanella spongiae]|uniref:TlpA family protein disulfide reductase n=2 Tax=Parashewanella spongiae TaxID=342950 RepID=A0A3A6U2G9_9GAMM|nr:TlpA disulfide reductase family protein [Parashewanella spongiae]RJY07075.1 TlpA family protein disulfide reductase [Parashewanella spongiae]
MSHSDSDLKQAPNFQLKDSNGKIHQLTDYKGQPLVLHFWATWCPYCKKLQPGLNRMYKKHINNGIPELKMLGVSFREDGGATPGEALTKRGINFLTLVDGDKVAKAYNVRGTPTTVFIDRSGKIVWTTNTSNPDDPRLDKAADFVLKRAPN